MKLTTMILGGASAVLVAACGGGDDAPAVDVEACQHLQGGPFQALTAGAVAYIAKTAAADDLAAAFGALQTRGFYLSPSIKAALADHRAGIVRQGERVVRLTRRQRQILALVADGHANSGIARHLNLAESTVKAHVSTLFDLLGVDNRAGCVREAALLGLLGPG